MKSNKEKIFQDGSVDPEEVKLFECALIRLQDRFMKVFMEEFMKDRRLSIHLLNAMIYAPSSISIHIFNEMAKSGLIDPMEEYPSFCQVYKNLFGIFGRVEHLWGKVTFEQWQEKYGDAFRESGHFSYEMQENND